MNYLPANYLPALLVSLGTIALAAPAMAQQVTPDPAAAARQQGAIFLTTEPASVNRGRLIRSGSSLYRSSELNGVANSFRVRSTPVKSPLPIPDSLMQNLPTAKPTDPIDFFRPPALDGGVRVRVGGD